MPIARLASLVVLAATAFAGCSAAVRATTARAEASNTDAPQQWSGAQSSVEAPATRVVRDPAGWAALWRELGREPPRALDVPREMAIAVFLGERRTAGYRVEISNVRATAGELVVSYREHAPARDKRVAQVLTYPWAVVAVPSSGLPVKARAVSDQP